MYIFINMSTIDRYMHKCERTYTYICICIDVQIYNQMYKYAYKYTYRGIYLETRD